MREGACLGIYEEAGPGLCNAHPAVNRVRRHSPLDVCICARRVVGDRAYRGLHAVCAQSQPSAAEAQ